jgi:hypothetical protein
LQRPDEVTTVHVPDLRSDVMKLILMLAYKEEVILTRQQIRILKESANMFGVNLTSFKAEAVELSTELDVKPGKVMDSLARKSAHQHAMQQQQQKRRLLPANGRGGHHIPLMASKPSQQLQRYDEVRNLECFIKETTINNIPLIFSFHGKGPLFNEYIYLLLSYLSAKSSPLQAPTSRNRTR